MGKYIFVLFILPLFAVGYVAGVIYSGVMGGFLMAAENISNLMDR